MIRRLAKSIFVGGKGKALNTAISLCVSYLISLQDPSFRYHLHPRSQTSVGYIVLHCTWNRAELSIVLIICIINFDVFVVVVLWCCSLSHRYFRTESVALWYLHLSLIPLTEIHRFELVRELLERFFISSAKTF